MIRKYVQRQREHQLEFDFSPAEAEAPKAADIPESAYDNNPLHKFRTFSRDSIFEQEKASRRNMEKVLSGDTSSTVDWRNAESVTALIEQLKTLPPNALLKRAIETKLTTISDEDTAWYHERNVLHRDSDDPHRGGTKWSMGSAAHFRFVDESRRKEFISLAQETLARGTEGPQVTLNELREETARLIHQIRDGLVRKPR